MDKHYCGECENFIPLPGLAKGKCKIKPYWKTRKGKQKEFSTTRMQPSCKSFTLSAEGFKPVTIICKRCGKEVEKTAKSKQIFCSDECNVKWNQEARKRKRAEEHGIKFKCHICGKPLEGSQKKYCLSCKEYISKPTEKPSPKKKRKVMSISEINTLALKEHLSYGEYVMKYGL